MPHVLDAIAEVTGTKVEEEIAPVIAIAMR
jgi:hypothetical protein